MKITLLGTGTSQGVPVIACNCEVCLSSNSKDNRLRCSVLIETETGNYVIDSGPDFRQQMLRAKVQNLDGILFTHEHKDHVAGLDDVRAFNHKDKKDMQIYCSPEVETALKREFHYAFQENKYPGIPKLNLNIIQNKPFLLAENLEIIPILVYHYKMPVFGFRIKNFTYITDAKTISTEEREKIRDSEVLVVNCLHEREHLSHFNLAEVLDFIADVKPKRAYLTHISHLFGKIEAIEAKLPPNVFASFDGMEFEF